MERVADRFERSKGFAQIASNPREVVTPLNPETGRIATNTIREEIWIKFHHNIGTYCSDITNDRFDYFKNCKTMRIVPGYMEGHYQVNLDATHPQGHKIWLFENGFIRNLWTETDEDLRGLPAMVVNTLKNIRPNSCRLRLKIVSAPPEWDRSSGECFPAVHYVRIIQEEEYEHYSVNNGEPLHNPSQPRIMILKYLEELIPKVKYNTLLASGERIIVDSIYHPQTINCRLYKKIKRHEVSLQYTSRINYQGKNLSEGDRWHFWDSEDEEEVEGAPMDVNDYVEDQIDLDSIGEANLTNALEK